MIRISVFFMYRLSSQLRHLNEIKEGDKIKNIFYKLLRSENAILRIIDDPIISPSMRISIARTNELLNAIRELKRTEITDSDHEITFLEMFNVQEALRQWEVVFGSEMEVADAYMVLPKGGFDTLQLATNAEVLFPADLTQKVSEAVYDIREAGKCLAFELPTAAGFHLHRANETILHRYYDAATGGKARPTTRNIADYIKKLDEHGAGDPKVKSALRDLKDLHRNPLIHPEHTLESVDEAIALLGSIRAVATHMLSAIPLTSISAPDPTAP